MQIPWLQPLKRLAEDKQLVPVRFDEAEWQSRNGSRRGVREFTVACAHGLFQSIGTPAPCLKKLDDEVRRMQRFVTSAHPFGASIRKTAVWGLGAAGRLLRIQAAFAVVHPLAEIRPRPLL